MCRGGVGADLAHYAQNNAGAGGAEPQIPLGHAPARWRSAARPAALAGGGLSWSAATSPTAGDDEHQLLARVPALPPRGGLRLPRRQPTTAGAGSGRSPARPSCAATRARWKGDELPREVSATRAKVTWVLGEFYWRVQRDERAERHRLRRPGRPAPKRLSREQTRRARSPGRPARRCRPTCVAGAFGLGAGQRAALQRDVDAAVGAAAACSKAGLIMFLRVRAVRRRC